MKETSKQEVGFLPEVYTKGSVGGTNENRESRGQKTIHDAKKQAGQWARLYKQVQAAEARVRQAEQDTLPSLSDSAEYVKQQEGQASEGGTVMTLVEGAPADERHAQLRAIASELLYWKGGLKVLRMAQLPKWRGSFKWQIEAKIEALQQEYAKLRSEGAKPDG